MTYWQRRQQAERLRGIALEKVLSLCGARRARQDPHKWHTPQGVLSVNGPKFMNWHCGRGGGGAIDLVMQLQHLDFRAAVDWLAGHFPGVLTELVVAPPQRLSLQLPSPIPASCSGSSNTWFTSAPLRQRC